MSKITDIITTEDTHALLTQVLEIVKDESFQNALTLLSEEEAKFPSYDIFEKILEVKLLINQIDEQYLQRSIINLGDSQAITIPKKFCKKHGLTDATKVYLHITGRSIRIIYPPKTHQKKLEE